MPTLSNFKRFSFSKSSSSTSSSKSKAPQYNHGPVVKTGPTYGQNRSRNNNGTWRRKRSDAI